MGSIAERTLEIIRDFVRKELCQANELEEHAFCMSEQVVTQNGQTRGLLFCLFGPRNMRLNAVCDLERRAILFYDSVGRRTACSPLPVIVEAD